MKHEIRLIVLALISIILVTGCSGKNVPHEFLVLKNAPLSLPPDYHLTPDGPTSDIDEVIDPQVIAQRALFGVEQ